MSVKKDRQKKQKAPPAPPAPGAAADNKTPAETTHAHAGRIRFLDLPVNAVHIIAILIVVSYMGILRAPFIFDDMHVIVQNPYITSLKYLPGYMFRTHESAQMIEHAGWRPVWYASFIINYMIGGLDPLWYHVFNLIIHLANSVLIYFITLFVLKGRSERPWLGAFLAGAVFAAHPLHTESVSYIVGRSALLSAMFCLFSFYMYLLYRERRSTPFIIAACVSFLLAGMSKENAVCLPLIVVAYDYMTQGKAGRPVKAFALLFVLCALYMAARFYVIHVDVAQSATPRGFFEHWVTEAYIVPLYIMKALVPTGLNIDPDIRQIMHVTDPRLVISLLFLAAVFYGLYRLYRKERLAGFLGFWFFLAISPETVMPITDFMAEHRTYLPLAGPAVLFGLWMERLISRSPSIIGRPGLTRMGLPIAVSLIIILFAAETAARNRVYSSDVALWTDTVEKSPHKARPANALGFAYLHAGKPDEAKRYVAKAIEYEPNRPNWYFNMGIILKEQGKFAEALPYIKRTVELVPDDYVFQVGLGVTYVNLGQDEKAAECFRKAIQIQPDYPDARYNLGTYYINKGDYAAAVGQFKKAVELEPHNYRSHTNLGNAYFGMGKDGLARDELLEALKYNPDQPKIHINLANVLLRLGDKKGALTHYRLYLDNAPKDSPDTDEIRKTIGRLSREDKGR